MQSDCSTSEGWSIGKDLREWVEEHIVLRRIDDVPWQ